MFTLHALNYPWTDSNYFWNIYSIPSKDIKEGDNTLSSSFRGVNDSFNIFLISSMKIFCFKLYFYLILLLYL